MKVKAWLKYLGYIAIIFGTVYLKGYIEYQFQMEYYREYKPNYVLYVTAILVMVLIGAIIGLERFLGEIKKEGKWRLNIPKLVLMVIPSLYISSIYFIAFIKNNKVYDIFVNSIITFFKGNTSFIQVFEIALGYFLITSFYKDTSKVKEAITQEIDPADMENDEDSFDSVEEEEESPEE